MPVLAVHGNAVYARVASQRTDLTAEAKCEYNRKSHLFTQNKRKEMDKSAS
jgi:hypothetical protein